MTSPAQGFAAAAGARLRRLGGALRRHPWRTAAVLPALALLYVLALVPFTPSIGDIRKARLEQPSTVLTADGKELAVFKRTNRDWVKLADMSPHVVDALIATEDRRFFEHPGLDLKRTLKAAFLTASGDRQGGSTLTQQLARNLYPEEIGRAPTVTRKLKEAITALKIEAVYSKDEILETYLNTVPFLYNAYGIEMAARTYFDKPAHRLDVLEAATLVGMLKGTSYYNPVLNPGRAFERRNLVMVQMVKAGKLAQPQYDSLRKQPLKVDFERQPELLGPAPHLAQQLRRWLIDWADRNGYDIHADGLRLHTTIDSRLQAYATQAVERQGERLQKLATGAWGESGWTRHKALAATLVRESAPYREARQNGATDAQALAQVLADAAFMKTFWQDKTRIQGGFLAVEPGTGSVRAWVGSRDFRQDQFDHVQQARRQPGSTFKPFVYGAAFQQGISPSQTYADQPVEIRIDARTVWRPGDVADYSGRMMTLREGLIYSKNSITAQLMQNLGASTVARVARAMGVRESRLDEVLSIGLGTSPVTLREMVAGYATIANSGTYIEPIVVTRVEDRHGRVLAQFQPRTPEQALSAEAAQTLLDVMRGVIDQGTGAGIRTRHGIQADVAGKTGTTQDNTDGWFILMHPQLVAGAWVGFNDSRVNMPGDWGQGSQSALPMVGDFMQAAFRAKAIDPKVRFGVPKGQSEQAPADLWGRVGDWLGGIFQSAPATVAEPPAQEAVVSNLPPPRTPDAVIVQPDPATAAGVQRVPEGTPQPAAPADIVRAPELSRSPEIVRAPEAATRTGPRALEDQARAPEVIVIPRDGSGMSGSVRIWRPPAESAPGPSRATGSATQSMGGSAAGASGDEGTPSPSSGSPGVSASEGSTGLQ